MRDGLGGLDDGAQVGFGLADQAGKDPSGIQFEQGDAKDLGGRFGCEAFTGPGDPQDEHAFGSGDTIVDGGLAKGLAPFEEPLLEDIEPADGLQGLGGFNNFEQPALLYRLGFLGRHNSGHHGAAPDHRERKGILGLHGG